MPPILELSEDGISSRSETGLLRSDILYAIVCVGLLALDMKSSKHLASFTPLDVPNQLHPGICWQSPTFPWISMKRRESCQFLLESSLSVEMIS